MGIDFNNFCSRTGGRGKGEGGRGSEGEGEVEIEGKGIIPSVIHSRSSLLASFYTFIQWQMYKAVMNLQRKENSS